VLFYENLLNQQNHLSLYKNSPIPRSVKSTEEGDVVATPILGGLHHSYSRAA
jgi:hypothetical protein